MKFDNSYFENDIRSGFFVPGMVKRSWAAQIEVLKEIDRICEKYNIQYFAEWGTLLGAIRHKGFIPWDDDMDICMKREDYNKFLQVAQRELPTGWALLNAYTDHRYTELLSRIVNGQQIELDDKKLEEHYQFPYPGGIDIFPLDYIARSKEDDDLQTELMAIVTTVEHAYDKEDIDWGIGAELVQQIEQMCAVTFDREKPIRQQLSILLDRLMSIYTADDADYITQMPLWKEDHVYRFPKEYFDEAVYMPFENIMVPVPKYYDAILKLKYGDYMRMVKNGSSHDYPFYKNLEKELDEAIGYRFKEYKFPGKYEREKKSGKQQKNKRLVLFLPFKAENWDNIKNYWEKEKNTENTEVIVASMPYYHCGFKGDILDVCDDTEKFPKELNVVDAQKLDIEKLHPDVIYIQNPCDKYDRCTIINPQYFSDKLCKYTDELVYIPWFVTDDFDKTEERSYANMENYCTMPGLVYADKVYVQSEIMRSTYIEKLTEWAGQDTKEYWEKKLYVNDITVEPNEQKIVEIPDEWKNVLSDEGEKKIILYSISAGTATEYKDELLKKIKNVLDEFEKNKNNIAVIYYQDEYIREFCRDISEEYLIQYEALINELADKKMGVLCRAENSRLTINELVQISDAYYGDAGELAHEFSVARKPVMIQDVSICD